MPCGRCMHLEPTKQFRPSSGPFWKTKRRRQNFSSLKKEIFAFQRFYYIEETQFFLTFIVLILYHVRAIHFSLFAFCLDFHMIWAQKPMTWHNQWHNQFVRVGEDKINARCKSFEDLRAVKQQRSVRVLWTLWPWDHMPTPEATWGLKHLKSYCTFQPVSNLEGNCDLQSTLFVWAKSSDTIKYSGHQPRCFVNLWWTSGMFGQSSVAQTTYGSTRTIQMVW